jgi:hypothetical protein
LDQNVSNPFERATAFFLFGSLQQFFFAGNKRQLNPGLSAVRDLPDIKYFSLNDSMQPSSHDAVSTGRAGAHGSRAARERNSTRAALMAPQTFSQR